MNGLHHQHQTVCNGADNVASQTKILKNNVLGSDILKQLDEYRQREQFTDAILSVDQEELHCHRCVLAASSPYFQATFSNQFQEAIDARVILHDVSPWIMKRILDYIYTGRLEISLDNAQDYLRTGHMLQYPAIVQTSSELLADHLHVSNCLGIREFASMFHCDRLEQLAYKYAIENFNTVVERGDELCELSVESLLEYLSSDNIEISNEMNIWKAIHSWVCHDVETRKKHLSDLLKCMRLSVLSLEELAVIRDDPLLKSQPKCLQLLEKVRRSKELILPTSGGRALDDVSAKDVNSRHQGYQKGARPSTLPRDMIILFGGSSDYELSNMVGYDPQKGRWNTLPSPPENIVQAHITSHNGTVFISGGIVNNSLSKTLWMFCCKERKWSRGAPLLEGRARHSSVVMDGKLYLSGGVRLDQSVVPMTEIHAYDIRAGRWCHVGENNTPKQQGTLLGFSGVLYELGGKCDDSYTSTMQTYHLSNDGHVTSSGEHYVLPCNGDPGPLRAVLDDKDLIIILWENTGQLFTLNTNGRRFYPIEHSMPNVSGCLVSFNHSVYILGGSEDNSNSNHPIDGVVLDLNSHSHKRFSLPCDLIVHSCVHVQM